MRKLQSSERTARHSAVLNGTLTSCSPIDSSGAAAHLRPQRGPLSGGPGQRHRLVGLADPHPGSGELRQDLVGGTPAGADRAVHVAVPDVGGLRAVAQRHIARLCGRPRTPAAGYSGARTGVSWCSDSPRKNGFCSWRRAIRNMIGRPRMIEPMPSRNTLPISTLVPGMVQPPR
jgi:hypothetical protein